MFIELPIEKAFTFIEEGPVTLITTHDGDDDNVMTISWTMAMDYEGHIAFSTGPWNHSFKTLLETKECVVCIPPVNLIEETVRIGTINGPENNKFELFNLSKIPSLKVKAPMIKQCRTGIECHVIDYIEKHGLIILEPLRVVFNDSLKDAKIFHAIGDGRFVIDGEVRDHYDIMKKWVPKKARNCK